MKKIKKFITYAESEKYEENGLGGMGGWFSDGHRWEDYIEGYSDEGKQLLEELRSQIIKNQIKCTGDEHQYSSIQSVPLWDDDTVDTYSYRAWGDLMAAIWSTEDNRDYNYMDFYM
jgi:hypothetical protein